uniref:Lipid-binding serum glycoprotein N-terminal domain-containing protein n=1 Tax=Equus asinus TaxID=9793 RepID=A0A9L0IZJ7_EQUAS|nr:latherin [Equus asinus]
MKKPAQNRTGRPSMQECLLWTCWMGVVRTRASPQSPGCPSSSATSPPTTRSLAIYKVCPTAESIGNQQTETQGISTAHRRNPGTSLKMLKVSCLFVLLCGLLVPSSAQQIPPEVSSQITDALTQGLLDGNFLSLLNAINLEGLLNTILDQVTGLLNILVGPLLGPSNAEIKLQDARLLQLSLEFSPDSKGIDIWIPLELSVYLKLLILEPLTLYVRTDIRVQLQLESDEDGKYRLAFGHCSLLPRAIELQSGNPLSLTVNAVLGTIENALGNFITEDLGAELCPTLNSLVSNLDLQLVNNLINLILDRANVDLSV